MLFTGDDSSWEAWLANEAAWWPQMESGIPLRRGFISSLDSGAFTQVPPPRTQNTLPQALGACMLSGWGGGVCW